MKMWYDEVMRSSMNMSRDLQHGRGFNGCTITVDQRLKYTRSGITPDMHRRLCRISYNLRTNKSKMGTPRRYSSFYCSNKI